MHSCKVFFFCVVLLASAHATSVTLTSDKEYVNVGDRVTFKCEVTDMVAGQFLRWQRVIGDLSPISLATNKYLETIFMDTGRFSTTGPVDQTRNPLLFSLTINSAATVDTGTYRCSVLGGPKDVHQDSSIYVIREVADRSISFSYTNQSVSKEVTDGQELKYRPGEQLIVKCTVSEVFPEPQLQLLLDGQPLEVVSDTDHHFKVTDEVMGEVEEWYTYTATYSTEVTYEHADKAVSCSAGVRDQPALVRGFTIKMDTAPPKIACDPTVVALERAYDVTIQCNVTSRPAITDFRVVYYRNQERTEENKEVLMMDDMEGNMYVETSRGKDSVSLIFSQVFKQDFRNYTFIVQNEAGEDSATVRFLRDPNQAPIISGASTVSIAVKLLLFTFIAHFGLRH